MGDTYRRFKVGAAQLASVFCDREATTEKACDMIAEAGRQNCELVCLPEAFIPTFPYWIMTAPVPLVMRLYKRLYANSVDLPSPTVDRLCTAAKHAGCNVVIGVNLRDRHGTHQECLFNAQLFISKEGEVVGVRRKLTPINTERAIWGEGDGSDLQVHEMSVGRVGALVCGEHTTGPFRYALAAMGEQIHVSTWPGLLANSKRNWDWQGLGESTVRSHAVMSQVFLINSCSVVDSDLLSAFEREGIIHDEESRTILSSFTGFSSIISPFGTYMAGPEVSNEEKLLTAEIDMEDIIEAKFAHNPLGYHNRSDVTCLFVNRDRTSPISTFSAGSRSGTQSSASTTATLQAALERDPARTPLAAPLTLREISSDNSSDIPHPAAAYQNRMTGTD